MSGEATPAEELLFADGPWRHRSINANGSQFHCVDMGEGPLVLFLHGFPDFWWTWRHQLPRVAAAGFRAVAMDLRGYGASDKPPRGYDGYTLAGDVAGVIRALGESDAALVGHDWGGFLAQTVGVLHAPLVRSVAVLGAAHPLRLRHAMATDRHQIVALRHLFSFQLPRFEHRITRRHAVYVEKLLTRWAGPSWRGTDDFTSYVASCRKAMCVPQAAFCAAEYHRWAIRSLTRRDGWRFAARMKQPLTMPILQLHGAVDPCILPATARGGSLYAAAGIRYSEIAGVGHFPHREKPAFVTEALLDFLGT